MDISVRFNGKAYALNVQPNDTIQQLCTLIEQQTGVFARNQKLICKGKVITLGASSGSALISSTNIKDGSSIMLMASSTSIETQGQAAARQACEARAVAAKARLEQQKASAPTHQRATLITADRVKGWQTTGVVGLSNSNLQHIPDDVWQLGSAVRTLSLSHNQLDNVPDGIATLTSVQRVLLSHNTLQQLPWPSFAMLQGLCVLDLAHNRLTCLADALHHLPTLTHLSLDHNHLTTLPPTISTLTNLRVLRVGHNALSSVPQELGACGALVDVDLEHNVLTSLPASLGGLKQLQRLNVNHNRLETLPSALLTECTSLRDIQCHDNPLSMERLRGLQGYEEYDARRRAKYDKQVDMKLLNTRFDEGADVEQYDRYATDIHKNRR